MTPRRWLRIIPVALIMYTISYVDRTNISLALDPDISTMMRDLAMDDKMKGQAAGIFFLGYVLLQVPGGRWASKWSAKKIISIFLVAWGLAAMGCGLSQTFRQFSVMRFLLGVAESGVFPATLVLLTHWFPRAERARATAFWTLCQPLAVVASGPLTGRLLDKFGWHHMLILEGLLPFLWLPVWWFCISDHPREAKWISAEERESLEATLRAEALELEPARAAAEERAEMPLTPSLSPSDGERVAEGRVRGDLHAGLTSPTVLVMVLICFLYNAAAYGCMTFFTSSLKSKAREFSGLEYGCLLAAPYALTAVIMVANSWHSDRTRERRGHVAAVFVLSGVSLIVSALCREHFWVSYAFLCLAVPGPFACLAPFWAIPAETLPRNLMVVVFGLVNAFGNLGGWAGPYIVGWLKQEYQSLVIAFGTLGMCLLLAAALAFLLPKSTNPHSSLD